jgi:hypothetical protein
LLFIKYLFSTNNCFKIKIFRQLSGSCSIIGSIFWNILNGTINEENIETQVNIRIKKYYCKLLELYDNSINITILGNLKDRINMNFNTKLSVDNIIFLLKEKTTKIQEYYQNYLKENPDSQLTYEQWIGKLMRSLIHGQNSSMIFLSLSILVDSILSE